MWQRFGDSKGWPDVQRTEQETIKQMTNVYETYKNNKDMIFYKEAVLDFDFTRKALYHAYDHHKDSQELRDVMDKLKEIHEVRNAKWWLEWRLKEGMVKMVLTNWHWREDKKVTENTNKNTEVISKEEQDMIEKALEENNK